MSVCVWGQISLFVCLLIAPFSPLFLFLYPRLLETTFRVRDEGEWFIKGDAEVKKTVSQTPHSVLSEFAESFHSLWTHEHDKQKKGGTMFIYVNHQTVFVCLLIILLARWCRLAAGWSLCEQGVFRSPAESEDIWALIILSGRASERVQSRQLQPRCVKVTVITAAARWHREAKVWTFLIGK